MCVRILAFGTYDVRVHPRVGVLIEGLRANGDEVVEVNVPLGLDTASRVAMLRQPWRLPAGAVRLARCWALLAVRGRRAYRRQPPDVVLVGYLGHFDVQLARLLFRGSTIVLDHLVFAADTAADRGESGSVKMRLLNALDRRALRSADVIVVDSPEHAALVPAVDVAMVVPVGAPTAWFDAGSAVGPRADPDVLRVVFFGLFSPLQGTPTIGRALGLLADTPQVHVLMIGNGQDLAETRRRAEPNSAVRWIDWVPSADLPAVIAEHDVCLGIFGVGPKALRVVPNKVYQGAAAGCAVITSDTWPQRDALGDAAVLIPPGDAGALAEALRALAKDPPALAGLRAAARDRARERFAPAVVVTGLRARLAGPGRSTAGGWHR
jgi:glycosyltransferase involved in cell wall biosynthesis